MENKSKFSELLEKFYTLDNNSKRVRFFKWVYGEDPKRIFKGMCPFFWTLVVTVLFFPLVLIIKLFGKTGTKFLASLEAYKRNSREKSKQIFLDKCSKELTDKEAYYLTKSSCWSEFWDYLDGSVYRKVKDQANEWSNQRWKNKQARITSIQKQKETIKESKIYVIIAQIVTFGIFGLILYSLYYAIFEVDYPPVDWNVVLTLILISGGAGTIVFLGSLLLKYILVPLFRKNNVYEHYNLFKL